ncbi:hypothetical protein Athai_57090 [Actinocatenispora thailandica]|uniref:Uncharacterized protein n=1 Tax=Actinocatenispora thailandica TaxID=227318 RepID=A0A7R7DUV7_9ACTN|nr:hypothetical protein [Actinocatenispora thailandica]BCJ38206.1 hypothetical protein Athai_57090 [Actinocatenispora thailandica]
MGWRGEGRSLTEAENAYADGILADAQSNEPGITRDLRDTAASVPGGRLVGEEHSRKSEESFKRKFADEIAQSPDSTLPEIAHGMKDTVRYTVEMPAESYGAGAQQVFDHLAEQGYEPWVEPKNTWGGEKYKGINSFWHDPRTGQVFEVQVHTPESFAAKMDTHEIYERQRTTGDPAEAARLQEQQNEIFRQVPVPEGAAGVGLPPGVEPVGGRHAPPERDEQRGQGSRQDGDDQRDQRDQGSGQDGDERRPRQRDEDGQRGGDGSERRHGDELRDEDGQRGGDGSERRHGDELPDEDGRDEAAEADDGPDELPQQVSDDEAHAAMAEHARETPAGYEFTGDPEMRPYTDAARPEDGYVNLDSHATRDGYLRVGDKLLTPSSTPGASSGWPTRAGSPWGTTGSNCPPATPGTVNTRRRGASPRRSAARSRHRPRSSGPTGTATRSSPPPTRTTAAAPPSRRTVAGARSTPTATRPAASWPVTSTRPVRRANRAVLAAWWRRMRGHVRRALRPVTDGQRNASPTMTGRTRMRCPGRTST